MARRRSWPGARMWACPANSSSARGRMRAARGWGSGVFEPAGSAALADLGAAENRSLPVTGGRIAAEGRETKRESRQAGKGRVGPLGRPHLRNCLLYTSDAADDLLCVDLGG